MPSPQQTHRIAKIDEETEETSRFDPDTKEKSKDALMSLLTHLKRQDDEAKSD